MNQDRRCFLKNKVAAIRQLPIRTINPSNPTDKAMSERMLSLHEQKAAQGEGARPVAEVDAEIRATDAEIGAPVYRLYGLMEEEIKIVEGDAS